MSRPRARRPGDRCSGAPWRAARLCAGHAITDERYATRMKRGPDECRPTVAIEHAFVATAFLCAGFCPRGHGGDTRLELDLGAVVERLAASGIELVGRPGAPPLRRAVDKLLKTRHPATSNRPDGRVRVLVLCIVSGRNRGPFRANNVYPPLRTEAVTQHGAARSGKRATGERCDGTPSPLPSTCPGTATAKVVAALATSGTPIVRSRSTESRRGSTRDVHGPPDGPGRWRRSADVHAAQPVATA